MLNDISAKMDAALDELYANGTASEHYTLSEYKKHAVEAIIELFYSSVPLTDKGRSDRDRLRKYASDIEEPDGER